MNTALTQDQIKYYDDAGFLVVKNFFSPEEVAKMKTEVAKSVSQMGKKKIAGDNAADMTEGETYYDTVFQQRLNLWKINPYVESVFTDGGLGKMLCQLTGADKMRIWHDQSLQKMPWGNPTAWHLDNPYWSFHSRQAISIWIALEDATIQNGCMYYLPGTHKTATFDNVEITENLGGLFEIYPEWGTGTPVAAEMKAGDAGFHNGLTAHGAGANMTPNVRAAMTCAFMPDGATFNGQKNILSDEYAASLKVGDTLQDDAQNPIVG